MYKTPDGTTLTYEIKENGYIIKRNNISWISQLEPYDKPFIPNGSYEDNAKVQCEELCKPSPVLIDDKIDEVYSALDDLGQTVNDLTNAVSEIAPETPADKESEVQQNG